MLTDREWLLLLDAIIDERVVPIIGESLFRIIADGRTYLPSEYLTESLSDRFCPTDMRADSLSDLQDFIEDYNFRNRRTDTPTNIYFEINQQLKKAEIVVEPKLKELVHSGHFPLVLCTTCLPAIDKVLGIEENRVEIYRKSMSPDLETSLLDGRRPELYYLFGRSSNLSGTFLATEDDFLEYIHCWQNTDSRPPKMSRYLSDKYLLVMGNEFPDWLFRFFWYSVKNFNLAIPPTKGFQGVVTVDSQEENRNFSKFINRVQALVCRDTLAFLDELNKRLSMLAPLSEEKNKTDEDYLVESVQDFDIFISYANEDESIASSVAEEFRRKGAVVWFDKNRLHGGDDYDEKIRRSISHSKRFVPILSNSTIRNERRYFRKEWTMALDENDYRLKMDFIIPVVIDDCPLDSPLIPELFKRRHILRFDSDSFENELKMIVRGLRI